LPVVLRYVLRNPVRAGLVQKTDQWPWSSSQHPVLTDPWPLPVPTDWSLWIEEPQFGHELARLRTSVNRQAPFGSAQWQEQCATRLGLESTLRPLGRPRKKMMSDTIISL
jgi:putative transposase